MFGWRRQFEAHHVIWRRPFAAVVVSRCRTSPPGTIPYIDRGHRRQVPPRNPGVVEFREVGPAIGHGRGAIGVGRDDRPECGDRDLPGHKRSVGPAPGPVHASRVCELEHGNSPDGRIGCGPQVAGLMSDFAKAMIACSPLLAKT